MPNITNAKTDEVTAAQLAVDAKVKQCKVSHSFLKLQVRTDGPASRTRSGAFWPTNLPLFQGDQVVR